MKAREIDYEDVSNIFNVLWRLDLTSTADRVFLLLLSRELDGEAKDIGHIERSQRLRISKRQEIRAFKELEALNMIIVGRKPSEVNHCRINRNVSTWKVNQ